MARPRITDRPTAWSSVSRSSAGGGHGLPTLVATRRVGHSSGKHLPHPRHSLGGEGRDEPRRIVPDTAPEGRAIVAAGEDGPQIQRRLAVAWQQWNGELGEAFPSWAQGGRSSVRSTQYSVHSCSLGIDPRRGADDREADFPWWMYVYNRRISIMYHREVASFAVLGDDNPTRRPNRFGYRRGAYRSNCSIRS